jgi:hypothetical protein
LNGAIVDSTSLLNPLTLRHGADAGSVALEATQLIEVVGRHPSPAFDDVSRVTSATVSEGDAGAVTLRAPRIVIDEGAVATTAVASVVPTGRVPRGGDITLDARFEGGQVIVRNGGRVDASTFIGSEGGRIEVTASESIRVEDAGRIEGRTGGIGPGGNVTLSAPQVEIARGGRVSAESAPALESVQRIFSGILKLLVQPPTDDPTQVTGVAGSVKLVADMLRLSGGAIATNAANADGGDIAIQAQQLVHLDAGEITASVGGGTGGNIPIDPVFVILENGSRIVATAGEGEGGSIRIRTDNFLQFPGSVVSATAGNPALSGTVEIHSPDVNLAGTLAPLPAAFLDAASLMRERCAVRRGGERAGSFAVRGPGGIPAEPDGWLPAPLALEAAVTAAAGAARPPALLASLPGPLLAPGACP